MNWTQDKILEQVKSVCEEDPETGCWLWRNGVWSSRGNAADLVYHFIRVQGIRKRVTHFVLEASGFPKPSGMEACHACDIPGCCNPAHLRWGTRSDNMQDMASRGRGVYQRHPEKARRGDDHPRRLDPSIANPPKGDEHWTRRRPDLVAQATEKRNQVLPRGDEHWTRRDAERGRRNLEAAWENRSTGEDHYLHKAPELVQGVNNPNAKITEDDVREIRRRHQAGESARALAKVFPLGPSAISNIIHRRTWDHVD